jgi:hypothetical protein
MPKNLRSTLHVVLLSALATAFLHAQTLSKEYIRLGGRVIAVENSLGGGGSLVVQPPAPNLPAGSTPTIQFTVSSPAPPPPLSWSITGVGSIGQTTGLYQVPFCVGSQQSIQVTASSSGYQNGLATITLTVPSSLTLPTVTFSSGITQCTATTSITTSASTINVNGSANVTFQAPTINLEPGFQVTGGATFDAKTQ